MGARHQPDHICIYCFQTIFSSTFTILFINFINSHFSISNKILALFHFVFHNFPFIILISNYLLQQKKKHSQFHQLLFHRWIPINVLILFFNSCLYFLFPLFFVFWAIIHHHYSLLKEKKQIEGKEITGFIFSR